MFCADAAGGLTCNCRANVPARDKHLSRRQKRNAPHAAGRFIASIPASLMARMDQTRLRYSCVRVSISILSPVATKMGTGISKPVASLAGLSTLPEVSPLMAGSV